MREFPKGSVDITTPDFADDPIAGYNLLRAETPVSWQLGARGYLLTRFSDVLEAFKHPDFHEPDLANGWRKIGRKLGRDFAPSLLLFSFLPFIHEGERHRQLRMSLARAVAPFANAEKVFDYCVARRLDPLREKKDFDLVADFAGELVFDVFCELMALPEDQRAEIRALAHISWALEATLPVRKREDMNAVVARCMPALIEHTRETIVQPGSTFLHSIHRALPADEADPVSATAHLAAVMLIMGNDALAGCIAFGVRRLLIDKGPSATAQKDWGDIWEDAMRYAAPVDFQNRIAQKDTVVAGCPFKQGDRLILSPLAANHDTSVAGQDADVIFGRPQLGYGLTFGAGAHVCVGAKMSSNIMRSAFRGLAALPPLSLGGPGVRGPGKVIRNLSSLPVQIN